MGLFLKVSNSLYSLAEELCANLSSQQNRLFQPFYIVTQTEGMNNWLKLQMADQMGIAANYRFLKPNDVVYHIYQLLGGKYSQSLSADSLTWIFYRLLNEREFTGRFKEVAFYYSEGLDKEVKRLALAGKVADLFDQYQIYRPEMIQEWNLASAGEVKAEEWQKYLWIKAKELTQDNLPDKTLMGQFILEALRNPERIAELKRLMPAVHIFGLSVITSYHLQLFSQLGRHIDFSFHILNPAPSVYWFEDRSEKQLFLLKKKGFADANEQVEGNSLLTSWGRLIQNTFSLFFQNEELINAYEEVGIEEPDDLTLLHSIQQDIFYNRNNAERKALSRELLEDGSVTINSCYTPAREVEVLYNYLVHLMDIKGEDLSARDIVVMVSDIDTYAPYIRAVFNNAPYSFHYTIADESFTASDSLSNALLSILNMNRQTFKAEDVLQLLDSGYIRKRFGISDLNLIRKIVNSANIRFGMEGDTADDTLFVSWKYGIERIMYGICMSGEEEFLNPSGPDLYPLDRIEGQSSAEIVRFCHFVQVLMDLIRERDRSRTVSEWVQYVETVLHDMVFEAGEDADEDYDLLLKELEKYNDLNDLLTEDLSFEVFHHSFQQALSAPVRAGSFGTGGVTFCSLIPMRSIPFKVVALLGLNFDKFPRKETPSGFNLMEKERRKGDRNIKENDKHLFLETILSARKYLYISYTGLNVKDNTVLPPSALVDELVDYIQEGAGDAGADKSLIVTHHPLHGFSRKYKSGDKSLYSYLDTYRDGGRVESKKENREDVVKEEVSPDALCSFFRNPFKGYYNEVLGIYYHSEDVLISETEKFDLDGLDQWKLKKQLLLSDPAGIPPLRDKLVKTGELPLKNMADITLRKLETEVSAIRQLFVDCVSGLPERVVEAEVKLAAGLVRGSLNNIYGDKLLCISWSKKETKYLQEAYIKYLVARAMNLPVDLYFISASRCQVYQGRFIGTKEALDALNTLMLWYQKGHEHILCFFPDLEIEPSKVGQLDEETFKSSVEKRLNSYPHPCSDPYVMREREKGYFKKEGVFEEFRALADELLLPLTRLFPEYYE